MKGVEDALGRLEGVQHVEVQQGALRVYITPKSDRTLDLTAIGPALRNGSARLVRMRIAAAGRVEGERFRIDGWPDAYPIEGKALPEGPRAIRANVHFATGVPTLHILD